jgi:hypothetical protein
MWFITAIATSKDSIKNPSLNVRSHRTFGFYEHHWDAYKAVRDNVGSMHECLYDYIIIECIEEGIHPVVLQEEWYRWDEKKWEATTKPKEFKGIVNWALG